MESSIRPNGFERLALRAVRFIGHQNWFRLGIRRRLVQWLFNPMTMSAWEFETPFFSLRYRGCFDSVIDWCVYFFGSFATQELKLLKTLASDVEAPVFWDIGANTGQHTLFMSQYCADVYAFEPYERVRERMTTNLDLNQIQNVTVLPFGLGERRETAEYFAPDTRNLGTGSFFADHSDANVPSAALNIENGDAARANSGLAAPDIIKLDVEGFEISVLRGLRKTLQEARPSILMEITNTTLNQLGEGNSLPDLFPYPHRIYIVEPKKPIFPMLNSDEVLLMPFAGITDARTSKYIVVEPDRDSA